MLDNALDYGIAEKDYWEMSLAEIRRVIDSKNRVMKVDMKQKATQDYILADLVGRSVARLFSKQNDYPKINEVYPNLFNDNKEEENNNKMELSAIRFRQFAEHFNKGWKN